MNIKFDSTTKVFRLDTGNVTYAMQVGAAGELRHLYFGSSLGQNDDLTGLGARAHRAFSPFPEGLVDGDSLNLAALELSCFGSGDYHNTAARVIGADGSGVTAAVYRSHKVIDGKPELPGLPASFGAGSQTLEVTMEDIYSGVLFHLRYTIFPDCDVIARSVCVTNPTTEKVFIDALMSAELDFDSDSFDMLYLKGKWGQERQFTRTPLQPGRQGFRSVRGTCGHQYNPAVAFAATGATEESGDVYGMVLAYSGCFAVEAEVDEYCTTRTMIGINPETFRWQLPPGESFCTPEALLIYSAQGIGGMSRQSHAFLMDHLIRSPWKHLKRPVLINNWEGTYFDFNAEKILAIASSGAKLGMEMLVLDDGWFGQRDDDTSSLGDWFVNTAKIGELSQLVSKVNALGMRFGLWFEPEMISENSRLYAEHPDWVLCVPGKRRSVARHQLVLDMSRQEIVDYLFQVISKVLHSANIEYVKWDMNRNLTEVYSAALPPERQGEVVHRYTLGVYQLHERLLQEFPQLLIEGCSGGGGRFDAGMLYYAPQIWCSDDSDPIERVSIQLGTSLFYPSSSMGAHVSASPNHQTQRIVSFKLRSDVALGGTFGYELDLTKLTAEEEAEVKEQIRQYHQYNDLIREGNFYRLTPNFGREELSIWSWVAKDASQALMIAVCKNDAPCSHSPIRRVRLQGLDSNKLYQVQGATLCQKASGQTLMNAGINFSPDLRGNGTSLLLHLKAE